MREVLNADTLFNTLAIARQSSPSIILVTEGDDDHFIIRPHINDEHLLLINGTGRNITLQAAKLADKRGLTGVRFLVDSDYDRFLDLAESPPPNVLLSMHHDLIMDIVFAETLTVKRVIAAHVRSGERRGTETEVDVIFGQAAELASRIAPLRIVNARLSLELKLVDFPFGKLTQILPDGSEFATLATGRSNTTLSATDLMVAIAAENSYADTAVEMLIGDHDFFRALARVLRDYGISISGDNLFTSFLTAIGCIELSLTDWYQDVVSWGIQNSREPFRCLRAAS